MATPGLDVRIGRFRPNSDSLRSDLSRRPLTGASATGPSTVGRLTVLVMLLALAGQGCRARTDSRASAEEPPTIADRPRTLDSRQWVLVPSGGRSPLDVEIRRLQERLRSAESSPRGFERLGWTFVRRGRRHQDPGDYRLARHAAEVLLQKDPQDAGGLLLFGYALHSLHHFAEAEVVARQLVDQRGLSFDYGLLGDALVDQGRLEEAAAAYQSMMDIRPGAQAFARAAHLLWLLGDDAAALRAWRKATSAVGPRNADTWAWMVSQRALHELRLGNVNVARSLVDAMRTRSYVNDSVSFKTISARVAWAEGDCRTALDSLGSESEMRLASQRWLFIDLAQACGNSARAQRAERELVSSLGHLDPRGLALFLSTRRVQVQRAVDLASKEIQLRRDVFTLDALAWAHFAAGNVEAGGKLMKEALAVGNRDARLHLHAALLARSEGRHQHAARHLEVARRGRYTLFPSELAILDRSLDSPGSGPQPSRLHRTNHPRPGQPSP
ncbi:MAG: tetratricopeptide repeat protein [Myxococcota bacterium]